MGGVGVKKEGMGDCTCMCVCVPYLASSLIAVLKQCRVRVMDLKKLDRGNFLDSRKIKCLYFFLYIFRENREGDYDSWKIRPSSL